MRTRLLAALGLALLVAQTGALAQLRGDGTTLSDWPVTLLGCDESGSGRLYRNGSDTFMDIRIRLAPNDVVVLARRWQ